MSRVLVVADDVRIRPLEVNLLGRGYEVDLAPCEQDELDLAMRRHPDAVIVDLQHAGPNGLDTVRDLRGRTSVPIVVLSCKPSDTATVEALDLGADDVLTSRYGVGELFARLRARMRRAMPVSERAMVDSPDFTLDLVARLAHRRGELVRLTPTVLELRATTHHALPRIDDDNRMHFRGRVVTLSVAEAGLARVLVEQFGDVVDDRRLAAVLPVEAAESTTPLQPQIAHLRLRVRAAGLTVRRIRRRGYQLESR